MIAMQQRRGIGQEALALQLPRQSMNGPRDEPSQNVSRSRHTSGNRPGLQVRAPEMPSGLYHALQPSGH
ncbi:MAG: hypothetical protein MZV63_55125 [Marinilabiliales bacterium]|nr:hypothetical protein [Marinilabiliales bacterium]